MIIAMLLACQMTFDVPRHCKPRHERAMTLSTARSIFSHLERQSGN